MLRQFRSGLNRWAEWHTQSTFSLNAQSFSVICQMTRGGLRGLFVATLFMLYGYFGDLLLGLSTGVRIATLIVMSVLLLELIIMILSLTASGVISKSHHAGWKTIPKALLSAIVFYLGGLRFIYALALLYKAHESGKQIEEIVAGLDTLPDAARSAAERYLAVGDVDRAQAVLTRHQADADREQRQEERESATLDLVRREADRFRCRSGVDELLHSGELSQARALILRCRQLLEAASELGILPSVQELLDQGSIEAAHESVKAKRKQKKKEAILLRLAGEIQKVRSTERFPLLKMHAELSGLEVGTRPFKMKQYDIERALEEAPRA